MDLNRNQRLSMSAAWGALACVLLSGIYPFQQASARPPAIDVLHRTSSENTSYTPPHDIIFDATTLNTAGASVGSPGDLGVAWQSGLYKIVGSFPVNPGGGGGDDRTDARIRINGSDYSYHLEETGNTNAWGQYDFSQYGQLNAGDVIRFQVLRGNNPRLAGSAWTKGTIVSFNEIDGQSPIDVLRRTSSENNFASPHNIQFDATTLNTAGASTGSPGILGIAWQDGLYEVGGSFVVNPQGGADRVDARILVNGSIAGRQLEQTNQSSGWHQLDFSQFVELDEGDEVALQVISSGTNPRLASTNWTKGTMVAYNEINDEPVVDVLQRTSTEGTFTSPHDIVWDAAPIDTAGVSPGTSDVLAQAWQDGLYEIRGNFVVDPQGGNERVDVDIMVNDTVFSQHMEQTSNSNSWHQFHFGQLFELTQGDIIKLRVTSGGNNPRLAGTYSPLWALGEVIAYNEIPPIPEPSTFLIWALGLLGLAWCARRRRTK